MSKSIKVAVLFFAIVSIGVGSAVGVRAIRARGREPSSRIETRSVGPSGQPGPVDVLVANVGSENEPPLTYGPFRIVSRDWIDPNPSPVPTPTSTPVLTDITKSGTPIDGKDQALLQASCCWATIGYIAEGFHADGLPTASTVTDGEVRSIEWDFQKGDSTATMRIYRATGVSLPIEIHRPVSDGFAELVTDTINGNPAVFVRAKPGQFGPQSLIMVDARGITTSISADYVGFSEMVKMAEAIRP